MRRATPQMRKYAEDLLVLNGKGRKGVATARPAALEICDRLRPHMGSLMGAFGFQAILERALRLASLEIPWLTTLAISPTGEWEVPAQLATKITAEQIAEGNVVLVAHLLSLLVALMGEAVTLRQLHEVWSKAAFDAGNNIT